MKKTLTVSLALLPAFLPMLALAQTVPPPPFTDAGGVVAVLCRIAGWMFDFLIVLVILFVLLAAFSYLGAGGDPEKVKAASNKLVYAAVAVAVALFARGFPLFVVNLVGGQTVTGC